MKKILLSILAIVFTVGAVSATAYALFSDTATISGLTISSGNADLKIALDNETNSVYPITTSYGDDKSLPANFPDRDGGVWLKDFYPGKSDWGYFRLKNESKSKISLGLKGTLTSASVWNENLAKNLYMKITYEDDTNVVIDWHSLDSWNKNNWSFKDPLLHGEEKLYKIHIKLSETADSTLANLKLENINFKITATQE